MVAANTKSDNRHVHPIILYRGIIFKRDKSKLGTTVMSTHQFCRVSAAILTWSSVITGALGQPALVRSNAEQGRAEAQFLLGTFYLTGRGVPQDYAAATDWFRRAAKQRDINAAYSLGKMYDTGLGVPRDLAQAAEWYQKAAELGHTEAQAAMGSYYLARSEVGGHDAIAARWVYRAAVQGFPEAQLMLAIMLSSGKGIPTNLVASYSWASIAAARLKEDKALDQSKALLEMVGSAMTPEQTEEARNTAANWSPITERPQRSRWDITREQDGILASLDIRRGEATVSWRFVRPTTTQLTEVGGTVDGTPLGIPQFEPYPQAGISTYILFLLDVTGPTREAQIEQGKRTLAEIVAQAQAHHQIDVAIYGDQLEILVPGEADRGSVLDLIKAAHPRASNANLGRALLSAINVPSLAPAERRAIFMLTDGHTDDTLNANSLIENAKRTTTSLNFIVNPSERSADLAALEQLAEATGGLVVKQDQLAAFLEAPFQLVDSGATVRFPLAHLHRNSQTDPKINITLKYGDRVLELSSSAGNEARLEREALMHVLDVCDSCTDDFRKQVQDRIDLIAAEEQSYGAAGDEPKRLREYVANCVACNFRAEAEIRANALDEIAAQAIEEPVRSKREDTPVSRRRHRHK
jgi:hypothetical protein